MNSPETSIPSKVPVSVENALLASGTTPTENSVAKVEMNGQTTYYESLDEAVKTVSDGNGTATITLLRNAELTAFWAKEIFGNITFIGGNYTVQCSSWGSVIAGSVTIESGNFEGGNLYVILGGTLNVNGGTISSIINPVSNGGTVNIYGGSVTSIEGNVTHHVSSISLKPSTLTLAVGESQSLEATVLPSIPSSHVSVTWSSDKEAVATVKDGKVTGVGTGTATITAASGGKSASCSVNVEKGTTVVTNKDGNEGYPTTFTNGDNLPTPSVNYFNITGSKEGFAYQWYEGDHTTGELTGGSTDNPKNDGIYTLVVTTKETSTYSGGEKRLLVTINPAEYTVTIPSNATAGGGEVSLTSSNFKIGQNGQVRVTVSGGAEEGKVTLTRQETGAENAVQITSQLLNGENGTGLSNESTVAVYGLDGDGNVALQQGTTGKLYFAAPTENNIPAGTYSGTVQFQISYEIAENNQKEDAG